MLPNDLQDLSYINIDAFAVPPLLFAVVTREKQHLSAVGENMFDFDYVSLFALGAVHRSIAGWGHIVKRAKA